MTDRLDVPPKAFADVFPETTQLLRALAEWAHALFVPSQPADDDATDLARPTAGGG